jgi:4-hydroxy-tetrahydrodipicolinate synthase
MDARALASVVAVPATPFREDGALDIPAFERVLERATDAGIRAITVAGHTGEFAALAADEILELARAALATIPRDTAVLVGVGGDLATASSIARRVSGMDAFGLMIHEPLGPHRTAQGWLAYISEIAESAPALAVVPYVRDAAVAGGDVTRIADRCPNVVAVKYAVPDPVRFASLVTDGPSHLVWLCGLAELWAPFLWPGGAVGFTSGLATVAPDLSLAMLGHLRAGDARATQSVWTRIRPMEELRARGSGGRNVPAIKEALAQLGLMGRTVRPPISELDPDERVEVTTILDSWAVRSRAAVA